jgi:hypothetical protein
VTEDVTRISLQHQVVVTRFPRTRILSPATMAKSVLMIDDNNLYLIPEFEYSGSIKTSNKITIPNSKVIVRMGQPANAGIAPNTPSAQVILVEPAGDIIPVQGQVGTARFTGVIRSKNSLTLTSTGMEVKFPCSTKKVLSFTIQVTDCPWSKSYLNLVPWNKPDVTIRVDGNEIPTKIGILTKNSDVFKAMFNHDTKEKQTGVVEIEDFPFLVVQEMIRFLMHNYCSHWDGHYEQLAAIAEKYNIRGMKQLAAKKSCWTSTPDDPAL